MEFPRLVYRSASDHLLVKDQDQYDDAMADGWYGSVPEAVARAHLPDVAGVPQTESDRQLQEAAEAARLAAIEAEKQSATPRSELETQARELGLKFDGRNSDASLSRMIDEALKS